ncbi:uncharacterized protein LOC131282156 [Anopheles ziemanni]|uniref:uncharacterized protein LOC131263877 n=1 Tax=Anopheles coustani TaxID=139045 RepID=UPI002658CA95|nr:uncharacterized protein LOC131263877 [Anopheles coustani]XP_058167541.1 uncharacterized protein LOC131282156 [Anopheles ziemanni]
MRCTLVPGWCYIPYEEKKLIAYLAGCGTTACSVYLLTMAARSLSFDNQSRPCCFQTSAFTLEITLVVIFSIVYLVIGGAFFWGIWREQAQCLLPFLCFLIAATGFLGHVHIDWMLYEAGIGERPFGIFAFVWATLVLTFASTIILLLYREMNSGVRSKKGDFEVLYNNEKF